MTRLARAEIAVAAAALALATAAIASPAAAARLLPWAGPALVALVIFIGVHDARTLTIPDGAVVALAAIAAALRLAGRDALEAIPVAADAVVCGGLLLLVREAFWRLRRLDALGLGDVKLAAACGALVGTSGFAAALLAASLAGLAAAGLARVAGRPLPRETKVPFGSLLAPAALVVWWVGG